MICFYCGELIDTENGQRFTLIPIERPYINLTVHYPDCIARVNGEGWETYLTGNSQRIFDLAKDEKDYSQGKKKPLTKRK